MREFLALAGLFTVTLALAALITVALFMDTWWSLAALTALTVILIAAAARRDL